MSKKENYHIVLKRVSIKRKQKTLLHEVTMKLPSNHILSVIGPDQDAKSAFLSLFNRIYLHKVGWQVSGKVRLNGKNIEKVELPLLRKNVGLIQSQPAIFPGSVWDNLVIGLKIHGQYDSDIAQSKVEEILTKFDIWEDLKEELDIPFVEFSIYHQQLICMTRTLLLEPQLLLLDRPTLHLTELQKIRLEEFIYQLKSQNTLIFIAENNDQAARLSDMTAFFYNGMLLDYGDTRTMFTTPQNSIVQNYLVGKV